MAAITNSIISHYFTNIIISRDIIIAVDRNFEDFTGYSKDDVYKKSVSLVLYELFKMRVDVESLELGLEKGPFLLFSKCNEVKEIDIFIEIGSDINVKVFTFVERPNSRLDDKLIFLERQFVDNVVGIAIFSVPDLRLLKANEKYLNFLDTPFNKLENSIGRPISEIFKGWVGSSFEPIWKTVLKTQKPLYLKEQAFEGFDRGMTYWDSTITPVFEEGQLKYIYEYIIEITDTVITKKQLVEQSEIVRQQNEQLECLFDNVSDGLFIIDENNHVELLNESAKIFFHMPENQKQLMDNFQDAKYYNICGDEVHIDGFTTKKVLAKGKIKSYRLTAKRNDSIMHYDVSGGPIFDVNREVKGAVICTRDITEYIKISDIIREQSESLLQSEMEKNRLLENNIAMKDEFLSTISHEFKTPLNVINSAIQAMELLCKDELTIKSKKYLKSIRQNTFRQLRLVNNILDITKIHAGKMKVHKKNIDIVFISKSIVESVILYAQQKHIQLDFKTEIVEKIIGIDDEKYERILLNLLSNAIKFTPEDKKITVNISLKKHFVRIEVMDKGFGIPKDKQKLIFERFGQVDSSLSRQAEGAGIGLSLVNALVNTLGGQISLKSEVGKGSSFVILLPDKKVDEDSGEQKFREITDNRLIQSIAIEFSSIYLG